jgi:hypothetical protein
MKSVQEAPMPPAPGQPTKKPVWKRWWFWVAVVLVIGGIGSALGGTEPQSDKAAAPPAPETAAPASPSAANSEPSPSKAQESPEPSPTKAESLSRTFEDGTWVVGADIKAGTYRVDAGNGCYWERLKNFSGSFDAIIANGNAIGGPIIVTIEKTDKGFTSQDCGEWSDDLKTPSTDKRTQFGDGMYIVGVDITPGTYRVNAKNGCYWERIRNFTGEFNGIIANDNTKGSTVVEISSKDAGFVSQDCGTWEKV